MNRIKILNAFLHRNKITINTDDGWGCVGIINGLTQEDGSGYSWLLNVFACEAIYPCTVQVYVRFNRDTLEAEKVKIV